MITLLFVDTTARQLARPQTDALPMKFEPPVGKEHWNRDAYWTAC